MDVRLSRRGLFRTGGLVALAASLPAVAPGAAWAQEPASASVFLGTAPDAGDERIRAKYGDRISTLFPHRGMVYYGYGDYSTNSGSQSGLGTNVSCYNPQTAAFEVQLQAYNTEAILVYRELSGSLYTPAIDPHWGNASFASNRSGQWTRAIGISGGEHIYDIAEGIDGELFMCGSAGGGSWTIATVWRSLDGGASWEIFYQEAPEADQYRDGYERFYWMGRIGTKLYVKADNGSSYAQMAPMRVFDLVTRQWATFSEGVFFDDGIGSGAGVVGAGNELFFLSYSMVYAFDGKNTRTVGRAGSIGVSDLGEVLLCGSDGARLVQGTAVTTLAADVTGPATLVGDVLYHATGPDLYSRQVTRPAPGQAAPESGGGGKGKGPDHPSNQPGKGKGKGKGKDEGGSSVLI